MKETENIGQIGTLMKEKIKLSEDGKTELETLRSRYRNYLNSLSDDPMKPKSFDLTKVYPETNDLKKIYEQLIDLQKCIDSFRPINKAQAENLREVFDTEYTYESNRIEGNTLTLIETSIVINEGLTISGKPLKDHIEAVNHLQAIDFIRELVNNGRDFNRDSLSEIHRLILQGIDRENAGFYRRDQVRISGSRHICPNYMKVPELMEEYFRFYEENKDSMHPVELAANMHERLVTIHPYIDGNGRTARLVMNLILLKKGYPITVIASDKNRRSEYYNALEASHISDPYDKTLHFLYQYLVI